ncbi:MAG: hypothetical protein AUJ49_06045 [Desulfovibrionaceae bacterium CG1_02_65_16]|nr:MAG: hypothetical protein AUJ49_06045 [Desulfovibrionaceae bacterium CG1_02_65_16]
MKSSCAIALAIALCWVQTTFAAGTTTPHTSNQQMDAPTAHVPKAPAASDTGGQQDVLIAGRGCCSRHRGQCGCQNGRVACCDGTLSPSCRCAADGRSEKR